jgi:hypothetical protein
LKLSQVQLGHKRVCRRLRTSTRIQTCVRWSGQQTFWPLRFGHKLATKWPVANYRKV